MRYPSAVIATLAAVGCSLALAACGGSSGGQDGPSSATSSAAGTTTAAGTTSVTTSAASGSLSKADFITQADAECATINTKISALDEPDSAADFPRIIAFARFSLDEPEPFYATIKSLADETADRDELNAKWITPSLAAFQKQKPIFQQLLAAAQAENAATVGTLIDQLDSIDTDTAVDDYVKSYGLTDCADLESS